MEALGILFGLLVLAGVLFVGPGLAIAALVRSRGLARRVEALEQALAQGRSAAAPSPAPATAAASYPTDRIPAAAPLAPVTVEPVDRAAFAGAFVTTLPPREPVAPDRTRATETTPAPAPDPIPQAPPFPRVPPSSTAPVPVRPHARGSDFATQLGPRILVATGALAFVVFLGLFVKYAWDQNWVGPTGRVLFGALLGTGLVAAGVRMMGREYRPLGQGLAAAGIAGLYVSAFAAHGFYALVPAQVAGLLMVGVTASAVLLAVRLEARLLATLAWVGGYMTPLLLSTGEDKALSLYGYLLLLDVGALVLDRRKPWPETLPIAMAGTALLYAGWYSQHFSPERFLVAALGIVLFTAVFAFGMGRKDRGVGLGSVVVAASFGLVLLAREDRPEILLGLSLALAAFALRLGRGWAFALVAAGAVALPFLAWAGAHYWKAGPDSAVGFGIAVAWLLSGMLLLSRPMLVGGVAAPVPVAAGILLLGGLVLAGLCADAEPASSVGGALLAYAGLCILARKRVPVAEAVGIAVVALGVFPWLDGHQDLEPPYEGWLVGLPAAAAFVVSLVVRGLRQTGPLSRIDVGAHVGAAGLLWGVVYVMLDRTHPRILGPAAVALACVYLALGLAARRRLSADQGQLRVLLGLAAGFLTLAIPVQLGLHGITLGWAAEGVLLVWLGLRYTSRLTRGAGYAVLSLAILRLIGFHLPLHDDALFRPVLNATFGTWLFALLAAVLAVWVARPARRAGHALDKAMAPVLSTVALLLLLGLLTGEARATFAQAAAQASLAGDLLAAEHARRLSGFAVSLLWTVFATGLLGAGLFARNRPLFYAGYALFALTAGKVVFFDLGAASMPYRMLSFLALAVLLMAGAYLNLRFRARLLPPAEAA